MRPDTAIASVVSGVSAHGYAIVREAVPARLVAQLATRAQGLAAAGAFAPAGIGRAGTRIERTDLRGDRIAWLDSASTHPAEAEWFAWLEALRIACNRGLYLGLAEFEGHYATYPPGAAYARHRDRFRDDDARVLSCVLYLNDRWRGDDGGALRLFVPDGTVLDVAPERGTFVAFLAAEFEHEVRPATRERSAVTGWFRRRAAGGG